MKAMERTFSGEDVSRVVIVEEGSTIAVLGICFWLCFPAS
jgi:hypothetical protein